MISIACLRQGWEDVGGMAEVRAALQESLELPTRYARLVAKAPLRLRTGAESTQSAQSTSGGRSVRARSARSDNVRC